MKRENLEGHKYGMLTVQEYLGAGKYKCICDCGNTAVVYSANLKRGHTTSCGCKKRQDITGRRYGKLVVTGFAGYRKRGGYNRPIWHCVCDCGGEIDVYADSLKSGATTSCGCAVYSKDIPQDLKATYKDGTQICKIQSIPTSANKSGVVGVNWDKSRSKWQASIRFRGKKYALGRYDNFADAVAARKAGEKKYFGQILK